MNEPAAGGGKALVLTLALALLTPACANSLGARAVRTQHGGYNVALQRVSDQQLLLNVVRMRYSETPSFLEITSIVTQLSLEVGAQLGASTGDPGSGAGVTGGFSTQPTITYVPSQGEQFVKRLLTPIAPETLLLLWESGWGFERVALLCLHSLNRVENSQRGHAPAGLESAGVFADLIERVGRLLVEGKLRFELEELTPSEGGPSQRVVLEVVDPDDPGVLHVLRILQLTPGREHYPLVVGVRHGSGKPPWDSIHIHTRGVLGILDFVSMGVEVPEAHRKAGLVAPGSAADSPHDSPAVTNDQLRVRAVPKRPHDTPLAVPHRDTWFYVDDADLRSKQTFALLVQIYELQAAPISISAPTLTLPAGR